jgi:hypothetical protein
LSDLDEFERIIRIRAEEGLTAALVDEMKVGDALAAGVGEARRCMRAMRVLARPGSPVAEEARDIERKLDQLLALYAQHRSVS